MITRQPYVPRVWQPPITNHIIDVPRCAVWAGMGVGKTVSTLTALDVLFMGGASTPALVLGPLRVARDVWPEDSQKWEHLRHIEVTSIVGDVAHRRRALQADASVHCCNYDVLPWLVEYWGERWPYKVVVADEATRLKSLRVSDQVSSKGKEFLAGQGGARAKALAKVAHKIERFVELTGTPAPNGLANLWGQMWFLDRGQRLGRTFDGFSKRWFRSGFNGFGLEPLPHAEAEIQEKIRDICLTVDLADYVDIAEPIVKPVYVDLPVKVRVKYREMEKTMFTELEENPIEAFGAAAKTGKLLQMCNGAAYIGDPDEPGERKWVEVHDQKLQALESILQDANGMPVLCGYEFKSDRARILRQFKGAVDISTPEGMAVFKAGKSPLGLAHPASLGHGVDGLQNVTNILVLFGQNWDLELYLQLIGRIGPVRQLQAGFRRSVWVYPIIARDTVDEDVMERRASKRAVQDILLESMKRRIK